MIPYHNVNATTSFWRLAVIKNPCEVCGNEFKVKDQIIMSNDGKKITCKHRD